MPPNQPLFEFALEEKWDEFQCSVVVVVVGFSERFLFSLKIRKKFC